jgi:hypothetical protein
VITTLITIAIVATNRGMKEAFEEFLAITSVTPLKIVYYSTQRG